MRILKAGKSKYYGAALRYFDHAKRCYQQASQPDQWQQVVDEVYVQHGRKTSFLPGFDAVVTGIDPAPQPSFLDQAKARWADMSPSDQLGAERAKRLPPAVPLSCIDTRAGNRPALFLDVDMQAVSPAGRADPVVLRWCSDVVN